MSEGSLPTPGRVTPVRTALTGETALQQASRMMEHLKRQLEELERRETNLNKQLIAFDNERRGLRLLAQQIDQQSEHREAQLKAREDEVAARESAADARTLDLETRERELTDERNLLAAERREVRESVELELAEERRQVDALREAAEAKESDLLRRESELAVAAADLERRTKFHEEHLNRLRAEVSAQRAEFESGVARERVWLTQANELLRLRTEQLRIARQRLEQRETSLENEVSLLGQQRSQSLADIRRERESLEAERASLTRWSEEKGLRLQQKQELVDLQAQNLEGRRQRLDKLRDELEQEQQETLESRLVVEQVYSQTVNALDAATAHERVQTARARLFDHYRELRDALTQRRQDCEDAQRQLAEKRDAFRTERDDQLQRLAEREDELAAHDRRLSGMAVQFSEKEASFGASREQWRQHRMEAERVIRRLLSELEVRDLSPVEQTEVTSAGQRIVPLPPETGMGAGVEINTVAEELAVEDDQAISMAA